MLERCEREQGDVSGVSSGVDYASEGIGHEFGDHSKHESGRKQSEPKVQAFLRARQDPRQEVKSEWEPDKYDERGANQDNEAQWVVANSITYGADGAHWQCLLTISSSAASVASPLQRVVRQCLGSVRAHGLQNSPGTWVTQGRVRVGGETPDALEGDDTRGREDAEPGGLPKRAVYGELSGRAARREPQDALQVDREIRDGGRCGARGSTPAAALAPESDRRGCRAGQLVS